jgi:hypothetical protein
MLLIILSKLNTPTISHPLENFIFVDYDFYEALNKHIIPTSGGGICLGRGHCSSLRWCKVPFHIAHGTEQFQTSEIAMLPSPF